MVMLDYQTMKQFCKKNFVYKTLVFIFVISLIIGVCTSKYEIFPVLFVSLLSVGIVYGNAQDSKNKLRLELFEKRYEVYKDLIKFCDVYIRDLNIGEEAWEVAKGSFRDINQKSKFLFGKDIEEYFAAKNQSFSFLVSHPQDDYTSKMYGKNRYEHKVVLVNIVEEAPQLFKPYLYFGDIKGGIV